MCVNLFYPQANTAPELVFKGVLYPMRVRDFRRFGFIEELFGDQAPPQAD